MIAKLEWTQSNAQENLSSNGSHNGSNNQQRIINNSIIAFERAAPKPQGDLNAFYWYQIFTLDPAVLEAQNVKITWRLPNYCNVPS